MVYLKSSCPVNTQLLSCVCSAYFHDWEVKAAKPKRYHLKLRKAAGYIGGLTTLIVSDGLGDRFIWTPEARRSHINFKVLLCQDTPERV